MTPTLTLVGSCTGPCVCPSYDMEKALCSYSCFFPSASAFLGVYSTPALLVGVPLLFQALLDRLQNSSMCTVSHFECIWSTGKTRVAFAQTLMRGWVPPQPLLGYRSPVSFLRYESDTGLCGGIGEEIKQNKANKTKTHRHKQQCGIASGQVEVGQGEEDERGQMVMEGNSTGVVNTQCVMELYT